METDREVVSGNRPRVVVPAAWSGSALLWLAMEPLAWWPLGYIALVPWTLLVLCSKPLERRDYLMLWLAGSAFWLVALYGLCFAHPAMFLGWLTLGFYLGAYTPLFVGVSRLAIARRVPVAIAVPAVWVGIELIRGYAFTGFSACLLGHTQADLPAAIQIADLAGSYAVSFVLAFTSAVAALLLSVRWPQAMASLNVRQRVLWSFAAVVLVVAQFSYGSWRLRQPEATPEADSLGIFVALVQRNEPVDYMMTSERQGEIFQAYLEGSQAAMRDAAELQVAQQTEPQTAEAVDLVVWPESMFSGASPWMEVGEQPVVPEDAEMPAEQFATFVMQRAEIFQQNAAEVQRRLAAAGSQASPPALLVGNAVLRFEDRMHSYSGAVYIGPRGRVIDWYGKQHLVMFGEYIPFFEWFPELFQWLPAPRVTPGEQAKVFSLAGAEIAPNICFETAIECGTIDQVRRLAAAETAPDVLVNLTNDAWFGGSPILDHHRRCSQFAAVSSRRPLLMASNTGPTMWVDGSGRIIKQLPKNTAGHILARPTRDGRWGIYQGIGDWPARGLAFFVAVLAILGLLDRRRRKRAIPVAAASN